MKKNFSCLGVGLVAVSFLFLSGVPQAGPTKGKPITNFAGQCPYIVYPGFTDPLNTATIRQNIYSTLTDDAKGEHLSLKKITDVLRAAPDLQKMQKYEEVKLPSLDPNPKDEASKWNYPYHMYEYPDGIMHPETAKPAGLVCGEKQEHLEDLLACLKTKQFQAAKDADKIKAQFTTALGALNQHLPDNSPLKITAGQFIQGVNANADGYYKRGLEKLDEQLSKCTGPCGKAHEDAVRLWKAFSIKKDLSNATERMAWEMIVHHGLAKHNPANKSSFEWSYIKFDSCVRKSGGEKAEGKAGGGKSSAAAPAAAASKSGAQAVKGSGSSSGKTGEMRRSTPGQGAHNGSSAAATRTKETIFDKLFGNWTGKGGANEANPELGYVQRENKLQCPVWFPIISCGTEEGAKPAVSKTSGLEVRPEANLMVGNFSASLLNEISSKAGVAESREEMRNFLVESYIEAYLTTMYRNLDADEVNFADIAEQIAGENTCHLAANGLIKDFNKTVAVDKKTHDRQTAGYKAGRVAAGVCKVAITQRIAHLAPYFGVKGKHTVTIEELVNKAKDAYLEGRKKFIGKASEKVAQMDHTLVAFFADVVVGAPHMVPGVRRIMRTEFGLISGLAEPKAKCWLPASDHNQFMQCMNIYDEIMLLAREAGELGTDFPTLLEQKDGTELNKTIYRNAPDFMKELADNYNLDPAVNDPDRYDSEGKFMSCMDRLALQAEKIKGNTSPVSGSMGLAGALDEGLIKFESKKQNEATMTTLNRYKMKVRELCTKPQAAVDEALTNDQLIPMFFKCDRKRLLNVNLMAGRTEMVMQNVLDQKACQKRLSASPALCDEFTRLTNERNNTKDWDQIKAAGGEVAMDVLPFLFPLAVGIPNTAKAAFSAMLGGGAFGTGMTVAGWIFEPSEVPTRDKATYDINNELAKIGAGFGSSAVLDAKRQELAELLKSPEMPSKAKQVVQGFLSGMVFGAFMGGGHNKAAPAWRAVDVLNGNPATAKAALAKLAAEDAGLLKVYRALEGEQGPLATKVRDNIVAIARERLKAQYPDTPASVFEAMASTDVIVKFEGRATGAPAIPKGKAKSPVYVETSAVTSDPIATLSKATGKELAWTENGKTVSGRVLGFDGKKAVVKIQLRGKTREIPLYDFLARVDRGTVHEKGSTRGWNFDSAMKDLSKDLRTELLNQIAHDGVKVYEVSGNVSPEINALVDGYRLARGQEFKGGFDPVTGQVIFTPEIGIEQLVDLAREARRWSVLKAEMEATAAKAPKPVAKAINEMSIAMAARHKEATFGDGEAFQAAEARYNKARYELQTEVELAMKNNAVKKGVSEAADTWAALAERETMPHQFEMVENASFQTRVTARKTNPAYKEIYDLVGKRFPDEMKVADRIIDLLERRDGMSIKKMVEWFKEKACNCPGGCIK